MAVSPFAMQGAFSSHSASYLSVRTLSSHPFLVQKNLTVSDALPYTRGAPAQN